jgi:large subunit ribosomal protein L30
MLRITLKKSVIGTKKNQRLTVKSLGLHKVNATVVHRETPQIRGMVNMVRHLVEVEEFEGEIPADETADEAS